MSPARASRPILLASALAWLAVAALGPLHVLSHSTPDLAPAGASSAAAPADQPLLDAGAAPIVGGSGEVDPAALDALGPRDVDLAPACEVCAVLSASGAVAPLDAQRAPERAAVVAASAPPVHALLPSLELTLPRGRAPPALA
jgi:hypothetical protein